MRHTLASMTQGDLEDRVAATTPVEPQGLFPGRCSSYAEPGDLCSWCGEPADHEPEVECDPGDVEQYVRDMRDADRMQDAGL